MIELYTTGVEDSWKDIVKRCVNYVGYTESYNDILEKKFIPSGRILKNSGKNNTMLLSCCVIGSGDCKEDIAETLRKIMIVNSTGCGIGISGKNWRYRSANISSGGKAAGSVEWFRVIDRLGIAINAEKNKRWGFLFSLPVDHPDIFEFIDKKNIETANISVEYNNNFIECVRDKKKWDLKWNNRIIRSIWARDLWDKIIDKSINSGEPGFLNIGLAEEYSNSKYIGKLSTTNPCGEQFLMENDCCCLGSLSLDKFIDDEGNMDWGDFSIVVRNSVIFLDKVLDVNNFPLMEMESISKQIRRIGLGIMGYHTALLKKGLKYESTAALEFLKEVFGVRRYVAYKTSIELAIDKGPFPSFSNFSLGNSQFYDDLEQEIKTNLKEYGMRNITVLTQAPNGSISQLGNCSSNIEPIFSPLYKIKHFDKEKIYCDPVLRDFIRKGKDISHFQSCLDISIEFQLEMQQIMKFYVDSGCSKTVNFNSATQDKEKISDIFLEYADKVKGVTFYPVGSREDEPLEAIELTDKIVDLIKKDQFDQLSLGKYNCNGNNCEV